MLFGLKIAPGRFQTIMDVIPASIRWKITLVYLNSTAVLSKSSRNNITQYRSVMGKLYEADVTDNLKKCKFFDEIIESLGHLIRPGRLERAGTVQTLLQNSSNPQHKENYAPCWDYTTFKVVCSKPRTF